jgi:hypothetical protein
MWSSGFRDSFITQQSAYLSLGAAFLNGNPCRARWATPPRDASRYLFAAGRGPPSPACPGSRRRGKQAEALRLRVVGLDADERPCNVHSVVLPATTAAHCRCAEARRVERLAKCVDVAAPL